MGGLHLHHHWQFDKQETDTHTNFASYHAMLIRNCKWLFSWLQCDLQIHAVHVLQAEAAVTAMQKLIDAGSPGVAALMLHRLQQQANSCWAQAAGDIPACKALMSLVSTHLLL